MTKRNILAGWARTGLFPFNPDRVLRDVQKPGAADFARPLPIRTAYKDQVPCPQGEVVQTPVTPVSSEGLASLLIITQTPHNDEASKQRHQRLVQKLAKAAQTSFARHTLDQDYIRFLSNMNNAAKKRRNNKSDILAKAKGEGRVMTYEDLEAARVKRAEKEAVKEAKGKGKGKRGRKPKAAPSEPETDEAATAGIEPGAWRAPEARMW